MKRMYLITGAAGHLAKTTIERLRKQDCFIRGLILPDESGMDDEIITYYKGDVTRPDTLNPFFSGLEEYETIVLHMAALITIQDSDYPAVYDVNVNGTRNIIQKCREFPVRRLLYVSSVHAIPEPSNGMTIMEESHFSKEDVKGTYAKTKAQATQLVLDAGKEGMDVVVVHPSAIIGPGDLGRNHMIQLLQMYLRRRLPMGVKGGYDFVDVRDVADGIVSAVDKGRSGECYLLTNRYASIAELLEYMRVVTGRKLHTACCPLWLAQAMVPLTNQYAKLAKTRPVFTKSSLQVLRSNGHFYHNKAARELQYHPRDLKVTIADTIAYLKAHETTQPRLVLLKICRDIKFSNDRKILSRS